MNPQPSRDEEEAMSDIMRKAWQIARERREAHGGTVLSWLALTPDQRVREAIGEVEIAAEELGWLVGTK